MRRSNKIHPHGEEADGVDDQSYFTYRPLSNLPTPPPTSRSSTAQSPASSYRDTDDALDPKYRGPAIHLVNLIPCSASLATASVPLVQTILGRANLPIETIALAVCVLDSLDGKFARNWRLSCPLRSASFNTTSKRHTLPPTPSIDPQVHQVHIDSVGPEIIIVAALVIAAKFTEDWQEPTHHYCREWGSDVWSHEQLNVTERCIMTSLNYRIMPLCEEGCLTDAMVDMQLAGRQQPDWQLRAPTPPDSGSTSEDDFVPSHQRSKTVSTMKTGLRLD